MNLLIGLLRLSVLIGLAVPLRLREYLGPETVMPLASVLAAIAGFFLVFWRLIAKYAKKIVRKIRGIPEEIPPEVDLGNALEESKKDE